LFINLNKKPFTKEAKGQFRGTTLLGGKTTTASLYDNGSLRPGLFASVNAFSRRLPEEFTRDLPCRLCTCQRLSGKGSC